VLLLLFVGYVLYDVYARQPQQTSEPQPSPSPGILP
jgi:hypothetical protein